MMISLLEAVKGKQIIIYSDENFISVTDINFPSVSFCPSLNLDLGYRLDYEQTVEKLKAGKIFLNNLTQDQ